MNKLEPIYSVVHLKTGNVYDVLADNIIECTNGREELKYVIYRREGMLFCREYDEFTSKFEII